MSEDDKRKYSEYERLGDEAGSQGDYASSANYYEQVLYGTPDHDTIHQKVRDKLKNVIDNLNALDTAYEKIVEEEFKNQKNELGIRKKHAERRLAGSLNTRINKVTSFYVDSDEQDTEEADKGMDICRRYYEQYGVPMLQEKYPEYLDRIAVGMVGDGSDCFEFDDKYSRTRDWGPGFCIWLTDDLYQDIGMSLMEDYDRLPEQFEGYHRNRTPQGLERLGVHRIRGFYEHFLGKEALDEYDRDEEISDVAMMLIPEENLACAVNGEVWTDPFGKFSEIRDYLKLYYSDSVTLIKLAQACAAYSENAQVNYGRMNERGDSVASYFSLNDGMKQALRIGYLLNSSYAPEERWLWKGARNFEILPELAGQVESIIEANDAEHQMSAADVGKVLDDISLEILKEMRNQNYIKEIRHSGDSPDLCLEHYVPELDMRSHLMDMSKEELINYIMDQHL